jgi:hypothetical protein
MPFRRQINPVVTVAWTRDFHSVGEGRHAHQQDQRERGHRPEHFRFSIDGQKKIEAIGNAAKGGALRQGMNSISH